jgi:hypothetical protein
MRAPQGRGVNRQLLDHVRDRYALGDILDRVLSSSAFSDATRPSRGSSRDDLPGTLRWRFLFVL